MIRNSQDIVREAKSQQWSQSTTTDGDLAASDASLFPAPRDDPDNPFMAKAAGFMSAKAVGNLVSQFQIDSVLQTSSGFAPAFQLASGHLISSQDHPRSPSPEVPQEKDYSSWFEPDPILAPVGFQAASLPVVSSQPEVPIPVIGFMKASNKGWIAPSNTSLTLAKQKMRIWQEGDPDPAPISSQNSDNDIPCVPASRDSPRPVLRAVENSYSLGQTPDTPSPAGAGLGRATMIGVLPSFSTPSSVSGRMEDKGKAKPFKSPFINTSLKPLYTPATSNPVFSSSPLNPTRPSQNAFSLEAPHHPLASTPITGSSFRDLAPPSRAGNAAFTTPLRPARVNSPNTQTTPGKPRFVTPFKPGMRPGEPGRVKLDETRRNEMKTTTTATDSWLKRPRQSVDHEPVKDKAKGKERWRAFDLCGCSSSLMGN